MEEREYKRVITYVKEQIAAGKLHTGDKLPTERELVQTLSLGRNSIREALRIMEAMGMLESRQGSGNYLSGNIEKTLTESMALMLLVKQVDYFQLSQLRRAIELFAYQGAIEHFAEPQIEELTSILEKMKKSRGSEKASLDKQFHDSILAGCENTLIISIMNSLSDVCSSQIEEVVVHTEPEIEVILMQVHEDMVRGIREKDVLFGITALNRHYDLIDNAVKTI
jgi:GntR family transcriptional repressor for pyruvate dehydrogenase complex